MDALVVGGGIAGLAAAHRLRALRPQWSLALLEAGQRFGGLTGSERRDGFLIECGADSILADKPEALDLAERLGLGGEVIGTQAHPRGAYVLCRGRLQRIPAGFSLLAPTDAGALLASPILSWRGRLRALLEPLLPGRPPTAGEGVPGESLEEFVTRRFGRELFQRLAEPLAGGVYGADPARLDIAAAMPRFHRAEAEFGSVVRGLRRDAASGARYGLFKSFRGGMQTLVDALVAALDGCLHLGVRAQAIEHASDGAWLVRDASGRSWHATRLVLAVPAWQAAQLLQPLDADLAGLLDAIDYGGGAAVTFGWRHRQAVGHALDAFGFVVPAVEGRALLAATWSSIKYAHRAPPGGVLMRAFLGGHGRAAPEDASDAELAQLALDELRACMGQLGAPDLTHLQRYPRAMPRAYLGHPQRVQRIEARLAQHLGLQLAGNAYHGVGLSDAVRSGEQAATALADVGLGTKPA